MNQIAILRDEPENTLKEHLRVLSVLRDKAEADGRFSAAINAEVSRGKALGYYDNHGKSETEKTLENMGVGDLERRLKQLERESTARDVTPSKDRVE